MAGTKTDSKHKPIYVITSKEPSLLNAQCEKLLDKLLPPQDRAVALFNADAKQVSVGQILDELRTAPFLTDKRVVLIKNADEFVSANRELLEKYFDNPCPTGILLLTVTSWPGNTKLAKKLPKVGELINITQPKRWQLPPRLMQYAREAHDKKLDKNAAELLIELTGESLPRLYSEIDKLALFAHTKSDITPADIESLIGHNRLFNVFAVIDAIITGNVATAVNRLRAMFAEDKSSEYKTLGAFAFHFRRMFRAKVLLTKGVRPDEITRTLRIWGNKDQLFAQLRKLSLKQLGQNLQQLAQTDYEIKTGQTKPQVAIEQLVLRLTTS